MRKYRGIRVDNGEWVYGCYVYPTAMNGGMLAGGKHFIINQSYSQELNNGFIEVLPESVGQETGLKDKNLWGGDIITFTPRDHSTDIPQKAVVKYCEKRACFVASSDAWLIPLHNCRNIEIIGSIHTNPELK